MYHHAARFSCIAVMLIAGVAASLAQSGFKAKSSPGGGVLQTADFNRDGYADLLESYGSLVVAFNDKSGGFGNQQTLLTATSSLEAESAIVADFNGDGYPDVAACVAQTNGPVTTYTVNVYLNQQGKFMLSESISLPYSCVAITAGDANRDGRQDLVVGQVNYGGNVPSYLSTYFGDGGGHFGTPVEQEIGLPFTKDNSFTCELGTLAGTDFKGNGNFDLLLYGSCNNGVVSEGDLYYAASMSNGNYILTEVTEGIYGPYGAMQLANLNNDLLPDVAMVDMQSGPHGSENFNTVAIVNQGNGNFSVNEFFSASMYAGEGTGLYAASAADFNGDGIPDYVVPNFSIPGNAMVAILNGQGNNTWKESQSFTLPVNPNTQYVPSVLAADFNNDNRPDFAVSVNAFGNVPAFILDYINTQSYTVSPCTPLGPGVHVCSPSGTTTGTVQFTATAAPVTGPVRLMQLFVDGKKIGNYPGNMVNTTLMLAPGTHTAAFVELEYNGQYFSKSVAFTVETGCTPPGQPGVRICSPLPNSMVTSPVSFSAAATPANGTYITAMRLYVDNVAKYTVSGNQLTTSQALSSGNHYIAVIGYQNNGYAQKATEWITVK